MKKVPYHKMMVEMDGQEAEIIIRALQLYVSKEHSATRKYKVTFYNNLILKIIKRKHDFHGQWKNFLLDRIEIEDETQSGNDVFPTPF